MARYFAIPFVVALVTVIAARMRLPTLEVLPPQDPPIVLSEPTPAAEPVALETGVMIEAPPAPVPLPAVQAPRPIVVVPAPVAPPEPGVTTEVVEKVVYVQPPTVIYQTTNNYYPVEPAPPSQPEGIAAPMVVESGFFCPIHRRQGCCGPKPPVAKAPQQDAFFKTIPFQPPTPQPAFRRDR